MKIDIANHWSMCSTLTIGMLGEVHVCGPKEFAPKTESYDSFWMEFEDARRIFEKTCDQLPRNQGGELDCYAFVVCSTSQHQPVTESHLERIGFWSSKRVSKDKNPDSDVKIWVISVRDFLKAYDAWRDR